MNRDELIENDVDFSYDTIEKDSEPPQIELDSEAQKEVSIGFVFDTKLPNMPGGTMYNFMVALTNAKKEQIAQEYEILKDRGAEEVQYKWDPQGFHFDVTYQQWQELPSMFTDENSRYVYFITEGYTDPERPWFNPDEPTQEQLLERYDETVHGPAASLNELILLIKELKDEMR